MKCYISTSNPTRFDFAKALHNLECKYCKPTTSCGRFANSNDLNYVSWFGRGNGGVNRCVSLGFVAFTMNWNNTEIIENVVRNVSLTHNTYETTAAAIFVVSLIKNLLSKKQIDKTLAFQESIDNLCKYEIEMGRFDFSRALTHSLYYNPHQYIKEIIRKSGEWGFNSIESVPVLISVFMNNPMNRETLLKLINLVCERLYFTTSIGLIYILMVGGHTFSLTESPLH